MTVGKIMFSNNATGSGQLIDVFCKLLLGGMAASSHQFSLLSAHILLNTNKQIRIAEQHAQTAFILAFIIKKNSLGNRSKRPKNINTLKSLQTIFTPNNAVYKVEALVQLCLHIGDGLVVAKPVKRRIVFHDAL